MKESMTDLKLKESIDKLILLSSQKLMKDIRNLKQDIPKASDKSEKEVNDKQDIDTFVLHEFHNSLFINHYILYERFHGLNGIQERPLTRLAGYKKGNIQLSTNEIKAIEKEVNIKFVFFADVKKYKPEPTLIHLKLNHNSLYIKHNILYERFSSLKGIESRPLTLLGRIYNNNLKLDSRDIYHLQNKLNIKLIY